MFRKLSAEVEAWLEASLLTQAPGEDVDFEIAMTLAQHPETRQTVPALMLWLCFPSPLLGQRLTYVAILANPETATRDWLDAQVRDAVERIGRMRSDLLVQQRTQGNGNGGGLVLPH